MSGDEAAPRTKYGRSALTIPQELSDDYKDASDEVIGEEAERLYRETVRYRDQISRMGTIGSGSILASILVVLSAGASTHVFIHESRWFIAAAAVSAVIFHGFKLLYVDWRLRRTRMRYSEVRGRLRLPGLGDAGWAGRLWSVGAVVLQLGLLVFLLLTVFSLPVTAQ